MLTDLKPLVDAAVNNYRSLTTLSAAFLNQWDQFLIHCTGYDLIPPMWLRYRIQGTPDIDTFIRAGLYSRWSIEHALGTQAKCVTDFPKILDFGCGCGRTLRWFRDISKEVSLHGTDIDSESIEWCRKNHTYASFENNLFEPPLPYPEDSFELIYALSVFTHLTEEAQFAWLKELKRILKPGGMLLLTFLGYQPEKVQGHSKRPVPKLFGKRILGLANMDMWSFLDEPEIQQLEDRGFVFVPYGIGPLGKDYGITYHRRDYITQQFSEILEVHEYLPDAFCGYLDVALLQHGTGPNERGNRRQGQRRRRD